MKNWSKEWCGDPDCKICDFKEEEKAMDKNNQPDNIKYFTRRLFEIFDEKKRIIDKAFRFYDDNAPTTAKEAVERILAGKYILPEAKNDYGITHIRWRDPNKKEDLEGHEAASKVLLKLYLQSKDYIMIGDPQKAYEAVAFFGDYRPITN